MKRIFHLKFTLGFISLTILLALALPSCRLIQEPEFKGVQKLKVSQLGLTESTLKGELVYFNPNKFNYKIRSYKMDLFINYRELGQTASNQLIQVDKMSTFFIPIELKVSMKNLPLNTWNIMTKDSVHVMARGHVMVEFKGILKELPVRYEGKQKVDLF
jgi:LEA14-like dessication related protein